jgi:hypothetical protein
MLCSKINNVLWLDMKTCRNISLYRQNCSCYIFIEIQFFSTLTCLFYQVRKSSNLMSVCFVYISFVQRLPDGFK